MRNTSPTCYYTHTHTHMRQHLPFKISTIFGKWPVNRFEFMKDIVLSAGSRRVVRSRKRGGGVKSIARHPEDFSLKITKEIKVAGERKNRAFFFQFKIYYIEEL